MASTGSRPRTLHYELPRSFLSGQATDAGHASLTYAAKDLPAGLSIDSSTGLISGTIAGGAAVNVQTRSGSNLVRGSAFEYYTDQHLKAWPMRFDDAALNTGDKPKQSYSQYGGTVGGPIKSNKVFYFLSYESTRDHKTVDRTVSPCLNRLFALDGSDPR